MFHTCVFVYYQSVGLFFYFFASFIFIRANFKLLNQLSLKLRYSKLVAKSKEKEEIIIINQKYQQVKHQIKNCGWKWNKKIIINNRKKTKRKIN